MQQAAQSVKISLKFRRLYRKVSHVDKCTCMFEKVALQTM